jgi:hypothetical protein
MFGMVDGGLLVGAFLTWIFYYSGLSFLLFLSFSSSYYIPMLYPPHCEEKNRQFEIYPQIWDLIYDVSGSKFHFGAPIAWQTQVLGLNRPTETRNLLFLVRGEEGKNMFSEDKEREVCMN